MIGALPPWRGVAPYTRDLLEALDRHDRGAVEFIDFRALYPPLLYPGGRPDAPDDPADSVVRSRVRRLLAWYNPLSWVWAGLTLRGRVVHAQCWSFILAPVYLTVLALARLRGRRVVLTLHNVSPHEASGWKRRLYASVFGLADSYIVHAHRNLEALVEAYPRASGRAITLPMGIHAVPAGTETRDEARTTLGLPLDGSVVLAFGNIRPYKGLDVLLRAFRHLLDARVDATLVVAGQPWGSFEPYQRLIAELGLDGRVRTHLRYVPEEDVHRLFRSADVAVYPYRRFEAQSAAATIALNFGLPVVVSDAGGLPDLVSDPRAVVPAGDDAALARALARVLSDADLRGQLAADARATAQALSWDGIAARTAALYEELAKAA